MVERGFTPVFRPKNYIPLPETKLRGKFLHTTVRYVCTKKRNIARMIHTCTDAHMVTRHKIYPGLFAGDSNQKNGQMRSFETFSENNLATNVHLLQVVSVDSRMNCHRHLTKEENSKMQRLLLSFFLFPPFYERINDSLTRGSHDL